MQPPEVAVFISSPGDVMAERERAERVVARLAGEVAGSARLRTIRWEHAYYTAADSFQGQIPRPSEADLVICILWKRLGSELPPQYRREDGTAFVSGTEYEFEDAIEAARRRGAPDVLVYRKIAKVLFAGEDDAELERERAQFRALKRFWDRWFHDEEHRYVAGYQTFETTDTFAAQLEDHLRKWLRKRGLYGSGAASWPVAVKGSPFRGLEPFDEAHAEVFFGRRRAVEQVRERLLDGAARACSFVVVLGMSGTGKSSLVRAGVVPRLMQPGAVPGIEMWRRLTFRPSDLGADPVAGFTEALYRPDVLPELSEGDCRQPADLARLFREAPAGAPMAVAGALRRAASALAAREGFAQPPDARFLLVLDQFEEIFALAPPARDALAEALSSLARRGPVWALATLRSDFYHLLQAIPVLAELKERGGQYDLLPPGPAEIGEIIRGPARAAGLAFETLRGTGEGLDEQLERAVSDPGALPLLEFALDELFKQRDPEGDRLTYAAYEAMGGLAGAVQRRAEEVYGRLPAGVQAELPALLRALVTVRPGDGDPAVARTAARDEVEATAERAALADAFIAARLLVAGGDAGRSVVRLPHESLLSHWNRARELIVADRETLRIRARVEAAAAQWKAEARHADFLLPRGRPLAEAEELLARRRDAVDAATVAFIEASAAAERAREEAERGAERHRREQAERNLQVAVGAADTLVLEVGQALRDLVGVDADRVRALLDRAERIYGEIAEVAGSTPAVRYRQAVVQNTYAEIRGVLGDTGEALRRAHAARAALEDLTSQQPNAAEATLWEREWAVSLCRIGDILRDQGNRAGALAAYRDAQAKLGTLAERDPDDVQRQSDLAAGNNRIGDALLALGDPAGALDAFRADLAITERLAERHPGEVRWRRELAIAYSRIGDVLHRQRDLGGALAAYRDRQSVLGRLADEEPHNAAHLGDLAFGHRAMGELLEAQGGRAAALEAFAAARAIQERLVGKDPLNSQRQSELSVTLNRIGDLLQAEGNLSEALAVFRRGEEIVARLAAQDPQNATMQRELAVSHSRVADVLGHLGDLDGAVAAYRSDIALMERLVDLESDNAGWQHDLASSFGSFGTILQRQGDLTGAHRAFLAAKAIAERLTQRAPRSEHWRLLASVQLRIGEVLLAQGDAASALPPYRAALALLQELDEENSREPRLQAELASALSGLGRAQKASGDLDGALAAFQAYLELAMRLEEMQQGAPDSRRRLTVGENWIARTLLAKGDLPGALAAAERGRANMEMLAAAQPADARYQHDLAVCNELVGEVRRKECNFATPTSVLREMLPKGEALATADPMPASRTC